MKYDSETEPAIWKRPSQEASFGYLPGHLSMMGVAVHANPANVEACLWESGEHTDWVGNRIDRMDVMSDVSGDAKSLYEECFNKT
jgi:hypothetical protein